IWSNATTWSLTTGERAVVLEISVDEPLRLGPRCGSESLLCKMITAGRGLTGIGWAPVAVRFRHSQPRDVTEHERFFHAPIEWNAPRTELVIDSELLLKPLLKADPALAAFFERHAAEMLRKFAEPVSLQHRLRRVIAEELPRGLPTLEVTASRMATSTRTLRR